MVIFTFDRSFEGVLTAVFDAYSLKLFPDELIGEGEPLPLFYDEIHAVRTDKERGERVWKALKKKLSRFALQSLLYVWMSELPEAPSLLFRYIRKAIDTGRSIEKNFGDADVLEVFKIEKKVAAERMNLLQFVRFQKAKDGVYVAALEPLYNVLPLTIAHFRDRFADQKWLLYDIRRQYGYYYDLKEAREIKFEDTEAVFLQTGQLPDGQMDEDERLYRRLWKEYFETVAIKSRLNPRKQRKDMPVRFWKYLTEKQ